jgi:hypothetical protein
VITYAEFLANAQPEDIRVMNLLAQGQKLEFNDPAEAESMFQQILRLDTAGFVLRTARVFERRSGVLWQSFDALIDPVASTYLAKAASERVLLSREPLPAV